MNKNHIDKNDSNGKAKKKKDNSPFSELTWNESDENDDWGETGGLHDVSPDAGIFGEEDDFGAHSSSPDFDISQIDDTWKSVPSSENQQKRVHNKKLRSKKRDFNLWRELDKASSKTVSRRDLLRGLFRFLPEDNDK